MRGKRRPWRIERESCRWASWVRVEKKERKEVS